MSATAVAIQTHEDGRARSLGTRSGYGSWARQTGHIAAPDHPAGDLFVGRRGWLVSAPTSTHHRPAKFSYALAIVAAMMAAAKKTAHAAAGIAQ